MLGVAAPTLSWLAATTAPAASAPSAGAVAGRLLVDLLALAVLVSLAHLKNRATGGLGFALVVLNVGLFATLVAISGEAFTAGAGFGLFGVLSLIRLRSASFTTPDMAYTFIAVVLGLITGLVGLPLWLAVGAAGLLCVLPALADRGEPAAVEPEPEPEKAPVLPTRKIDVVLDGAFGTADAARAEVESRLGVVALDVVVDEVDYVREVTKVRVTVPAPHPAPVAPASHPAPVGHPAARPGVVTGPWAASGQRLPHQLPPPQPQSPPHSGAVPRTGGLPDLGAELGLTGGVPLSPDVAPYPAAPVTGGWAAEAPAAGWATDGTDSGRRARRLRSAQEPGAGESGRLPRLLGPAGPR